MSVETKDRITCHVLDTTLGKPARGVRVKLELISTTTPSPTQNNNNDTFSSSSVATATANAAPTSATAHPSATNPVVFESQTDEDGRIKVWLPYSSPTSSGEVPVYTLEDVLGSMHAGGGGGGESRWTLRFDSAGYFGGADKTFYPEVDVTFTVREGERYHVPLLLAPYAYMVLAVMAAGLRAVYDLEDAFSVLGTVFICCPWRAC
ncbi:Transthyretin [Parathielavia hyrcaniae]|uniref:Transthyretin n=1 Tax=Parathielavia hyrcaniae TaxID=113614 RepID=A0AAN6T4J3_9PEZI|nr:Transthyretin [Parathielavia hyrcaniae]